MNWFGSVSCPPRWDLLFLLPWKCVVIITQQEQATTLNNPVSHERVKNSSNWLSLYFLLDFLLGYLYPLQKFKKQLADILFRAVLDNQMLWIMGKVRHNGFLFSNFFLRGGGNGKEMVLFLFFKNRVKGSLVTMLKVVFINCLVIINIFKLMKWFLIGDVKWVSFGMGPWRNQTCTQLVFYVPEMGLMGRIQTRLHWTHNWSKAKVYYYVYVYL